MPIQLRDYMYLDDDLVERLLSQVEGGVASEEAQTEVQKFDKQRGAGAKAGPLSGELARTAGHESSASRTVRQTPDSACSRLINVLTDEDSLQFLEAFDEEIWLALRRGEALEVESALELSGLAQLGSVAEALGPMATLMDNFGEGVDAKAMEAVNAFAGLAGMMKAIPVLAQPLGAPDYTFIASLNPEALRVEQDQISGEATVVATFQRRLRPDENWTILDALGLAGLPREMRRKMGSDLASTTTDSEIGGMVVKPPAALITPIAIFR